MSSVDELRKDAEELQRFFEQAERPKVKDILSIELRKIETEIFLREEKNKEGKGQEPMVQPSKILSKTASHTPTTELRNYAWDQSDNFMKLYVTVKGVESVPKGNITCNFTDRSLNLLCKEVANRNYTMDMKNLAEDIDPVSSYFKIKTDTVLLMLKKKELKKKWDGVTSVEKKMKEKKEKKPDFDESKDPSESLMGMLKQMYDDGDDDMKRTLAKAWTESREKKGADML